MENVMDPTFKQERRDLMLFLHAAKCQEMSEMQKETCDAVREEWQCLTDPRVCEEAQKLFTHAEKCLSECCPVPKCAYVKKLVEHVCCCNDLKCFICTPYRRAVLRSRAATGSKPRNLDLVLIKATNAVVKKIIDYEMLNESTIFQI